MAEVQEKEAVRREMRRRRKEYAHADESSGKMTALLLGSSLYHEAKKIFLYVPFRQEPDLTAVLTQALADGKDTAIPQMVGPGEMVFRRGDHPERWVTNSWGIREPDSREEEIIPDRRTLILVPGLSFDRYGYRVGYGGGYYDRFLKAYPESITVGAAFDFQIVDKLPQSLHDRPVQYIVSEKALKKVEQKA